MQIIVVGAGKVGSALVRQLSMEDHNITVVDVKPDRVREISTIYDVMGVTGNGSSYGVLSEAGIDQADMLIAVTHSDEVNLLCCVIAKQASHCHTVARVRSPIYADERNFLQKKLGISMLINPEQEAAKEVAHLFQFPSAIEIHGFGKGRANLMRFRVPANSPLIGIPLKDLGNLTENILIAMVTRKGEVMIPDGNFVVEERDAVSIIGTAEDAGNFLKKIGIKTYPIRNTMIVGGGKVAFYLAKILSKMRIRVKIIEKNPERCKELSEALPDAMIVQGDGSDHELLREEHLESMDSLLASTSIDEENIILSLYAKGKIRYKVVTQLSHLEVSNILNDLDLDSIVSPKNLTTETLLRYIRATANGMGSNVETLYKLMNGRVEALEFLIQKGSEVTGMTLTDMKLQNNTLIGGILRKGRLIIPGGQDQIYPGDSVIVLTTNIGYTDVHDILRGQRFRPRTDEG